MGEWDYDDQAQRYLDALETDDEPYPGQAPCPHCFESSGYMGRVHSATWYEPAWEDSDPTSPCPVCNGTGTVDSPLVTLADLEDLAADEQGGAWTPDYLRCDMGVGCDEVGVCYAEAHDQPERCPSYPRKQQP